MTGVGNLWMVLFRLPVELPFIFLANTLRSFLALFLFLRGRLRGFGLNVVCVCSVDDVVIFGALASPLRCGSCWNTVRGWTEEFGAYTEEGGNSEAWHFQTNLFGMDIEVGLTRL